MRNDNGHGSVAEGRGIRMTPDMRWAYDKMGLKPWGDMPNKGGVPTAVSNLGAEPTNLVSELRPHLEKPRPIVVGRYDHKIDPKFSPAD